MTSSQNFQEMDTKTGATFSVSYFTVFISVSVYQFDMTFYNWQGSTQQTWWRHQMRTVSALLTVCEVNLPVIGGFPSQKASYAGFDVFFDVGLNKWFKQTVESPGFETPGGPLWRHCNELCHTCQNKRGSKDLIISLATSKLSITEKLKHKVL